MGNKFRFIDDKTSKAKKTHFTHTEEEIILTLPDESGVVVTTNTVNDILDVDDNGNPVSGYILKPDIGDNAGINEESNNELIPRAEYITSNAYVGPLEWTRWEASLTDDFSNLVDSTSDPKDKDEWLPNVSGRGIGVYVRYRFHSGVLRSPFSDTIHYKTPTYGINPFVITVNDSIKPLIRTSEFSTFGEEICGPINHVSTTWVIKRVDDNVVVFKSERDTNNLLKIQIGVGILEELTNYIVYVTYHTDNDLVPNSVTRSMSFISPRVYIETPVLTHVGDNSTPGIVFNTINGSKYKINNTDEPHLYTKWELFTFENNRKTLVYSVDSTNFKESFDISRLATNNNIEYLCEATYYSANYRSETGSVKFKVIPFRSPNLRIITLNQNTDLFGNTANAELKNIYNYLEDGYRFENVRFKVIDCAKWDNGKYVVSKEIFDLAYAGPIVLITSEDFEIDKKVLTPTTALNYERIIIRIIDKYNNTNSSQPWLNAVSDESTVTAINKKDIQSFLVPVENNKYRRYYFFYPLLLDKPYNDKQHKVLENHMDISLYFEHTKYVTEAATTDQSIALAFSGCKSAFQYMYNNVAYNSNTVGSFTFRLNPNIKPKPTTTYSYNYPYILKQFGNKLPMNVTFYDNGNKVTTYISPWNDNTTGEVTLRNEIANKTSYNKEYTVIPSLRIGNMFNIVLDAKTVTFKPSELIAPIPTIKTTPITDVHMQIDISNVKYDYKSYSPIFNPAGTVSSVDYSCDPKSIRYVITKDSDGSVVYDKTFTDKFEITTMGNAYKVIPVKSLSLKTYKNDYDEPGDLVLSYSTKYKLSITMTAKNGVTKTSYDTFNTGTKPTIIVNKPTVTATQVGETKKITANSSAFSLTGMNDKRHKATEWLVYDTADLNTPLYRKTVTNTSQLTTFTFEENTYQNLIFWGKTYTVGVRYQASNNQWSDIAKTNVTIYVPTWFKKTPTAVLASLQQSGTKFNYKVTSVRHPHLQYAKNIVISLQATLNPKDFNVYDGIYKDGMYNIGAKYRKSVVVTIPYKGNNPTSYTATLPCDLECWILEYNTDTWIEWYDGTFSPRGGGITEQYINWFTQEERNNMFSTYYANCTKNEKVIDHLTAPKTNLRNGVFNNAVAVRGNIESFELGTKPPGITGTTWQLFKSGSSTADYSVQNDGININQLVFDNGKYPFNAEYVIKAKYVNTKYGYETPIGTSTAFNPAAVITMPYFKVTVDWNTQEFVISDFYYPFDQYVKGYALSVFRRTIYNSNGCTDLNGKTATYNNVINTPLFKKATTNYRCFCIFSWYRNEPPSYPRSTFRGPEFINVPDGWTDKHSYPNLVNGLCGPNDTVHVDLSCHYNDVVNPIDTSGVITTRLRQIIPNETIDPNTTIIQYPHCQFNGLGTWRKSLGKSPNGQRFKLHLDDNLWTLPKVNGKYSYISTNILIIPVFHDNTFIYRGGTFDATAFNNRWTASTIKRHTVQTANGYKVDNQIFSNAAVTWAEIIVHISPT